jgi:cytochrome c553
MQGERPSGFMALPATALDKADLEALVSHFAALPRAAPAQRVDPAFFERGEAVARDGVTPIGIPACLGCHGAGRSLAYPDLAGQPAPYLAAQLRLFRGGKRNGTPYARIMTMAARGLKDGDIAALAAYFSALEATPATSRR